MEMRSIFLLTCVCAVALAQAPGPGPIPCSDEVVSTKAKICEGGSGTLLPAFNGQGEADWPNGLKVILYLIGLFWAFTGVGIVTDVFMEAIEVITSKEKEVEVEVQGRTVRQLMRVWNPTIANLSLMALGSSAPEVILSVIEVVAGDFFAGALGPSTIVGSAAFNLLVIIAVCMLSLPAKETRRISAFGVFLVTAVFSIFAYVWLLIILVASSPDVIEIWEGVVTFLFFPVLLTLSYMADRGMFDCTSDSRVGDNESQIIEIELDHKTHFSLQPYETSVVLRDVSLKSVDPAAAANIAAARKFKGSQVSRAQYRINATRLLVGSKPVLPDYAKAMHDIELCKTIKDDFYSRKNSVLKQHETVGFVSVEYHVREDIGTLTIAVKRTGVLTQPATVQYSTVEGTAKKGEDYVHVDGEIHFEAGQDIAHTQPIEIVDDDVPESDEFFLVKLHSPSAGLQILTERSLATIVILDDDRPGVIGFKAQLVELSESSGTADITVHRVDGCKGKASVHYFTKDGTAHAGRDFEAVQGRLEFEDGQVTQILSVPLNDDDRYESAEHFMVVLDDADGAELGPVNVCKVIVFNDDKARSALEKISTIYKMNADRFVLGKSDWAEQFADALEWPDEKASGYKVAVIMHIITLPWKIFGACIPPTLFGNGWVAFCVALAFIGFITALIGDLASLFGCSVGLEDSVTAITFVALGTSLPDTFASRAAAIGSPNADAAVTNVTGSNSVNVFVGLGLSWLIASIYWPVVGRTDDWKLNVPTCLQQKYSGAFFYVPAGDLAFSVIVFTMCCLICLGSLLYRRFKFGAELGGPYSKQFAGLFVSLWFMYVLLSSLQTYGHIPGI